MLGHSSAAGGGRHVGLSLDQNVALGDVVAVGFKYVPSKQLAAK